MRRTAVAACVSLGVLLMAPAAALAADGPTLEDTVSAVNTTWVIVAGVLVMFMQAGFLFLEFGFSRAKNAGLGVVKILTNFSIA
ncbi:MAG: ammonium transporter, Amt family, partial [Thermoleophilaceae bacterium]|nr:ammonium transporter, Amt family [Thermoleophilaceae bacterium]